MSARIPLSTASVEHLYGFRLAVADAVARRLFQRHVGTPFDLRPVEFTLLMLLLSSRQASPKQLAQAVHAQAPQVTVVLDRLGERGWIERLRSSTDGRGVRVVLTDSGRDLAGRAHAASLTMEQAMLRRLTPGERAMLLELLAKVAPTDEGDDDSDGAAPARQHA